MNSETSNQRVYAFQVTRVLGFGWEISTQLVIALDPWFPDSGTMYEGYGNYRRENLK